MVVRISAKQFIYFCLVLILAFVSSCGNDKGKDETGLNKISQNSKVTEKAQSGTISDEDIVSLFKNRVAIFKEFFSQQRRVLIREDYSKSPTGLLYVFRLIQPGEITYDVQKTNSLVSPHVGYIDVAYTVMTSMRCGDIAMAGLRFYSSIEKVVADDVDSRCFESRTRAGALFGARFIFTFQKGRWMFERVVAMPGKPDESENFSILTFGDAFAVHSDISKANSHWRKLID